jgi:hypothetical protein
MNIPRTQAIFACSLLIAGIFSAPVFAQGQGVIATWDCPTRSGHAPAATRAPTPAPVQYSAVKELEQYVAQLQAELEKSDRSRSKRSRR